VAQASLRRFAVRANRNLSLLDDALDRIEWLPEGEFRRFQYDLVAYYRRQEAEQERIATALQRRFHSPRNVRSRDRIDEILTMLEHVHDPLIR
jgi:hypothetical protein